MYIDHSRAKRGCRRSQVPKLYGTRIRRLFIMAGGCGRGERAREGVGGI